MLYYDSRADEAVKAEKNAGSLISRRMYPENYTMQNKLEETLTARCNIVDVSQRNNNSFTRMKY